MKSLPHKLTPLYLFIYIILSFFSCNNEELFVQEIQIDGEETIIEEEIDENQGIVLFDDNAETSINISTEVDIISNDTIKIVNPVISFEFPVNGDLVYDTNSTPGDIKDDIVTYTPNPGFSGEDFFEYTVCSADNMEVCDTANVSISVETFNNAGTSAKAFPTAYGGGSNATGGRGKPVYKVKNLNSTGPGSLVQALEDAKSTNGGNIIFDVSGVIQFDTAFLMTELKNISILGQTAPEGGITLTNVDNCSFCRTQLINSDNVIIRYLKFRPNYNEGAYDGLDIISSSNIMIDHCSFSWGSDEAISTRSWSGKPSNNITFQRILIAESKTGSLMGNGDDFDMAENQSTHKNLFFNVNHRFPNVQSNGRMDIINNVVYDWGARLCNLFGRSSINYINNYHGLGYKRPFSVIPDGKSKPLNMIAYDSGDLDIYAKGNYIEDVFTDLDADNKTLFYVWGPDDGYAQNKLANSSNFTESMHTLIGNPLPILSATENFEDVVNNVGANAYIDNTGNVVTSIDAIDREYLEIIKSGGYERFRDDNGEYIFRNYARYINFHANVNNVPINSRKENYDTDGDGMPDAWEIANNLNHLVKDALGDINDNGYTNLEEFFNIVDK